MRKLLFYLLLFFAPLVIGTTPNHKARFWQQQKAGANVFNHQIQPSLFTAAHA